MALHATLRRRPQYVSVYALLLFSSWASVFDIQDTVEVTELTIMSNEVGHGVVKVEHEEISLADLEPAKHPPSEVDPGDKNEGVRSRLY